jgi:RNA polymerase sigma factor (sigma-70 family)
VDSPTLESVVRQHGAWIRKTLFRLGIRPDDLEDILQEVLRAVARGLPAFDPARAARPEGALSGWLFAICERQAANHRRASCRRAEVLRDTDELDKLGCAMPTCEESFLFHERRARLQALLDGLEPQRRAVIVAYELDGVPMADVASMLGIPVNTAWNRLRLAREDIRAGWEQAAAAGAPALAEPQARRA